MKKNVLVLGSGGREYAFAWKLAQDSDIKSIYCIPGNAGTQAFALNVDISLSDHKSLLEFVLKNDIDFTIVGPEGPLDEGIVNYFQLNNQKIFGPTKNAAQLESSKIFARDLMKKYNIPHPEYIVCHNQDEVEEAKELLGLPIVLKADGLAAGKGVVICHNQQEFEDGLSIFFEDKSFGSASEKISVEKCISGPEISVFTICDGLDYIILNNAQDHKRIFDDDLGPNTGGMGAYAPTNLYSKKLENVVKSQIIEPTLHAMVNEGNPYSGFLYFGLMLVEGKPYVIEYNVRMGDPETQVVIPMMDISLCDIITASLNRDLKSINYKNKEGYCATVVIAADGYPHKYDTGFIIDGLQDLGKDLVFHAGTSLNNDNKYVTSGGRVLNVVGYGASLELAIKNAYRIVKKINFKKMYYRSDIGKKGLKY